MANNYKRVYLDNPGTGEFKPLGLMSQEAYRNLAKEYQKNYDVALEEQGSDITIIIQEEL